MANALVEGENFVVDYDNDKPMYTQQVVETPCKSHCSPTAEICVFMCA